MNIPELDLIVLKSILSNKKNALTFINECDTKLFSPEAWNAANLITSYIRTYKEVPTLRVITEKLAKGGNDKVSENIKSVWNQLDSIEIKDQEFKHDLEKFKNRFAEKELNLLKDKVSKIQPGNTDVNKITSEIQKTLQNIKNLSSSKTYDSRNIKEHLSIFVDKFNAKKDNPNIEVGLMTGYSFLDFATNGLKPADFVLVAGESGHGKSLLLNNIAIQCWMQDNTLDTIEFGPGKNLIYFSLEMPYEDCFMRILSRLTSVPVRNIENAKLDKEQFSKVKKALDFIKRYPYEFKIVDITEACANDLEAILTDHDGNCDVIFIDYLGIMQTNEKSDEADWMKQGIIAYEIRSILRRYNLPGFSAVQLNRKTQSSGGKGKEKDSSENIGLNRLARSATIATHATHVVQIEARTHEELYGDMLYHLIKNRKGPKGKGVCYKNLACCTLIDKPFIPDDSKINDQFTDIDDISDEVENLEL